MKTGMEVADDVLEGQSLKSSVKKRLPQGIKRAADGFWLSKETEDTRRTIVEKDGIRARAVL